jgi:hypothetical protein
MNARYCYWSVCDGAYVQQMRECIRSAREAGVFRPFHVFTTEAIDGAECYEPFGIEKERHLFKLIYLRAGMTRLNFDYFVWVDADTRFRRNPEDLLGSLARAPLHVPLTTNLSGLEDPLPLPAAFKPIAPTGNSDALPADALLRPIAPQSQAGDEPSAGPADGTAPGRAPDTAHFAELVAAAGVENPVYWPSGAFWIVHHDAIERVCALALHFLAFARLRGLSCDANAGIGWAMQMFCADPEAHTVAARPDLWGEFRQSSPDVSAPAVGPFTGTDTLGRRTWTLDPAIVHIPVGPLQTGGAN